MVKSDVRRDYYSDLGLQPSCEAEDVKKQFRKLALKFHPDRNPGREAEFNAKFQAIQAANEILSDPQQRLKYDTDRLRAGYGKFYGPPPTKANTQRKTQPSAWTRQTATPSGPPPSEWAHPKQQSGPSAGARRYASHARAGPQQWQKPQDEGQTRADAFRGFSNMRNSQGWQGFDPATGHSAGAAPGPGAQRQPFGNYRPKSAFETFQKAYAKTDAPKKKYGFAPGAAGGDEPMARNTSAYSSNSRTERPNTQYFESAVPPTAKKPATPEPPQHPFSPEFERTSRGYAQTGKGERTFVSSTPLGRSESVRTPSGSYQTNSRKPTTPTSGRSGRHRSVSPKPSKPANNYDSTSASESEDDEDSEDLPRSNGPKPRAVPKSRLRSNQKFSDMYRQERPGPGTEQLKDADPLHGHQYANWITPKGHTSDSAAFPKGSNRTDKQYQPAGSPSATKNDPPTQKERPQSTAFGRSSTHDLHKKFSAEDWREHLGQFDLFGSSSTSTSKESLPKSPNANNRGRTNNRRGTTTSAGSPLPNPFGPTPFHQPPPQQQPTPFAQAKFSADSWAEQLRNMNWAPAAEQARQANVPQSRSPKKQPRATKLRSTPQPANVATEADEAKNTINGERTTQPNGTTAPDVEAMDLDDDLPTPPEVPPVPGKAPVDGSNGPSSANTSYPDLASHAPDVPPVKKVKTPTKAQSSAANADARAPLFNLDNLRNTVPFSSTTGGGIENLEDVHATLPFESQAKQHTTTKRDIKPRVLQLPNPPKRPKVPELTTLTPTSTQRVLPRDKWQYYVSAMGTYMHEWNAFNRRMLKHFNARQEANETGLAPGWISAVGDTSRLNTNDTDDDEINGVNGKTKNRNEYDDLDDFLIPGSSKGGFSAYLRGVEEDIQVRKHWDVACELHRECILDLGRLREWIRNGGKVV
ncbi:uncharacterized protein N7511_008838 [Penicillium nucicola]|uniref:uncharacterized protein n=1 Tax=Penicillium nucicola TaxID=1850975 RepID=UPI002545548F|nr:uncharacterized protein N7511_008838 [Penicillium nucicola]KAJ5747142.1 hypothetical protein N7511_008838 [Penicillium nucicola]